MAGLAASVYCNALFEIAIEKNEVEKLSKEAEQFITIWKDHQELSGLINNPAIKTEKKQKLLKDIFTNRLSSDFMGFLIIMTQKGRQYEIAEAVDTFINVTREYMGIGDVCVTSAVELSILQKHKVEKQLLKITGYDSLRVHYGKDPMLLGGMVIKIGNKVIDGSIRTQVEKLTKSLNGAYAGRGEERL